MNPVFNDSFVWALTMYCCGGYFRRFGEDILPRKLLNAVCLYLVSFALLLTSKVVMPMLADRFCPDSKLREAFSMYYSPLVCFSAIALFAVFYRLKKVPSFFSWIAPSICGIYLIHDNNLMRKMLWHDWLNVPQWDGASWLISIAIGLSMGIFLACMLIEKLRGYLLDKVNALYPSRR